MVANLIVNADDFGLTESTNQSIIDAHQRGIVTSTSLLANGYAFDHAVRLTQQFPTLGIGVHLTLTEGPPLTDDAADLFGANGKLPLSNQPFARALMRGQLPHEAIRREFTAQVEKILAAGITPTHIDGHKYIHLLPGITSIAAQVAHTYQIPVMRVPHRIHDPLSAAKRIPGLLILGVMGQLAYPVAKRAGLQVVDRLVGFVQTGHLTKPIVEQLLRRPLPGFTELLCHPGYRSQSLIDLANQGYAWINGYAFEEETAAVSDSNLRDSLEKIGWKIQNFRSLLH